MLGLSASALYVQYAILNKRNYMKKIIYLNQFQVHTSSLSHKTK